MKIKSRFTNPTLFSSPVGNQQAEGKIIYTHDGLDDFDEEDDPDNDLLDI